MSKLVFFDLDGTLFSYNSAYAWMMQELRGGHITWWQALRGCWWYLLYALGISGMDEAIRKASLIAKGQKETEMRERVRIFWEKEVSQNLRKQSAEIIEAHRKQGDQLAILTSSSDYLSEYAAAHWDIPHILCNRLEVKDNKFTGILKEPICFGTGKLHHAKLLADQLGYSLEDCIFYTDSYSDFPAMEAVGKAVAVHPDRRLSRAAKKLGWEIVYWK